MNTDSETLLVQAWSLRELDSKKSIALLDSIDLGEGTRTTVWAKMNVVRSFHFSRVYDFGKTLDACTEALEVLIGGDPLWLARLYGRLAVGFHYLGDISAAHRNFQLQRDSAFRCDPEHQHEELFHSYNNMGHHFFKIADTERALKNYKKAYSYITPDDYLYGYLQVNHAKCLIKQKKYKEATVLVNSALETGCRLNIVRIRHYALPVLANLAAMSNHIPEAEMLYLEAVSFASDNDLPVYDLYLQLAELYLATDNLNQAKGIIEIAAETSRGSGDELHAMRVDEVRYEIHVLLGDYKLALANFKAFHKLKRTLRIA